VASAARGGGGATPLAAVPKAPDDPDTLELRLALVCYGGVSLAIYMHGVTKEIQKLVAASAAFERDQDTPPWDQFHTEHAYWQALKQRAKPDGQVRTRVVVDIIAGTSAGGINGIILAKALAHDLPQDSLRKVWLERGDIKQLMASRVARAVPFLPAKVAAWAGWNALKWQMVRKPAKPPLDGNRMFRWIREALAEMDDAAKGGTLMPPEHELELFVTVTDFFGYDRLVPADDPKRVHDHRHRHALVFGHGPGRDQLGRGHNAELAFAARATSSFPGAFPPINLANIAKNAPDWEGLDAFKHDFWSIYDLSAAPVDKTHFVDGGVLDNFPLRHAIDAIRARPASLQVDRKLIYIEPHPVGRAASPDGTPPTLTATITGGLSGLPRREPVLDDLLEVRELNERIARVGEVVAAAQERIDALPPPSRRAEAYEQANETANADAAAEAGFAYATYIQLKLRSVVEWYAELACSACRFPGDSNHAFFLADVLTQWAVGRGILAPSVKPTDPQLDFLRAFDLDYAQRRLRFVISDISKLYGKEDAPPREQLNVAKERLYRHVAKLVDAAQEAIAGSRSDPLRALFDRDAVRLILEGEDDPQRAVADFAGASAAAIDDMHDQLGRFLADRLGNFGQSAYETLVEVTEGWKDETRKRVLDRYIRFPFWDVLTFPLQAMADVAELDPVEVVRFSPEDVKLLAVSEQDGDYPTAEEKLKGVGAMHFGAFFKRSRRENDYLWGRLDAAERIMKLLLERKVVMEDCRPAFTAILDQEQGHLTGIEPLFEDLRKQVG
jgi:patatin-related protein